MKHLTFFLNLFINPNLDDEKTLVILDRFYVAWIWIYNLVVFIGAFIACWMLTGLDSTGIEAFDQRMLGFRFFTSLVIAVVLVICSEPYRPVLRRELCTLKRK